MIASNVLSHSLSQEQINNKEPALQFVALTVPCPGGLERQKYEELIARSEDR